jgi:N-acetylmuramoyl-L-alanine amidase
MKTNSRQLLISTAAALLTASSPATWAGTVILDPGHGGVDPGVTADQFKESAYVFAFAKQVEAELKGLGHVTILTRGAEQSARLKDREKLVADTGADVVIGLHVSSSKDPAQRGIRIFQCPKKEVAALLPAERGLPNEIARTMAGISPKPELSQHNLGKAFLGSPKGLVLELGYISNPEDLKNLLNPEYQRELAKALAVAIDELY